MLPRFDLNEEILSLTKQNDSFVNELDIYLDDGNSFLRVTDHGISGTVDETSWSCLRNKEICFPFTKKVEECDDCEWQMEKGAQGVIRKVKTPTHNYVEKLIYVNEKDSISWATQADVVCACALLNLQQDEPCQTNCLVPVHAVYYKNKNVCILQERLRWSLESVLKNLLHHGPRLGRCVLPLPCTPTTCPITPNSQGSPTFETDDRSDAISESKSKKDFGSRSCYGPNDPAKGKEGMKKVTSDMHLAMSRGSSLDDLAEQAVFELSRLMQYSPLSENILAIIAHDVLDALTILHTKLHITHSDIKPSNIVLSNLGDAKSPAYQAVLIDFGCAMPLDMNSNIPSSCVANLFGAPKYKPPERYCQEWGQPRASVSCKQDIWALGVVILELWAGCPWEAVLQSRTQKDGSEKFWHRSDDDHHARKALAKWTARHTMSDELSEFLDLCLKIDPKERPSARELMGKKFITTCRDRSGLGTFLDEFGQEVEKLRLQESMVCSPMHCVPTGAWGNPPSLPRER